MGQVNTSVRGIPCQKWASDTPHITSRDYEDSDFPEGSHAAAENYCRNPDDGWLEGVWCYTMNASVRWDICDVPQCGKFNSAV